MISAFIKDRREEDTVRQKKRPREDGDRDGCHATTK